MNLKLACWVVGILLIPLAFAQSRVALTLDVFRNDSVELASIHAEPGQFDQEKTGTGYVLSLERNGIEWRTHIPVSFMLWDTRPALKDKETITAYLPYPGNKGRITFTKNDTLLWSFDLVNLCDNDGRCEASENAMSCRMDCPRASTDRLCLPIADGYCDPDCATDVDSDCQPVLGRLRREDLTRLQIVLGTLLLLVVAFGIYLAVRKKPRR
ncbi:hypothetical protein HY642_06380 [Candidatus Woesearchaeota archaeon]|nr:hypothetical protein [Candidatus Woesearchaeota archaeon]